MFKGIIVAGVVAISSLSIACVASAQRVDSRAQELATQLDKTKHKVKDKRGVHFENYTEVRNEAVTRPLNDLSGHYVATDMEDDIRMDLNVAADGTATATGVGYENIGMNSVRFRYTFTGRVDGAVLRGTAVREDGRKEPFEAVFVNRTVRSGEKPSDATVGYQGFGLGYIREDGTSTHRVFLEKR